MKRIVSLLLTALLLLSCFTAAAVSANAAAKLSPGFYVIGTFNSWSLDKVYRMQSEPYDRDSDKADYYILKGIWLNAGDELKAAYSADGINRTAFYPDSGPQTNYLVQEDSYYNIALALPTEGTAGCWDWQLWVEPCDPPIDVPAPTEPEPVDRTKELWETGAQLTAADIEEAVNDSCKSSKRIDADEITIWNSYRFNCAPAYIVDYNVKDFGVYCCVILEELLGDYLLYSTSSYESHILVDNKLYTLTKAYKAGVLTEEMLAELVEADYRGGDFGIGDCRIISRYIKGDADGDGVCDIIDATRIQRYEANITTDSAFYKPLADVDGDSDISVIDATLIQRSEAGLYTIG